MNQNDNIRIVTVKCLEDHVCMTHHMSKGREYDIQSDHARALAERGIVEIRPEAHRAVKSGAEKRG